MVRPMTPPAIRCRVRPSIWRGKLTRCCSAQSADPNGSRWISRCARRRVCSACALSLGCSPTCARLSFTHSSPRPRRCAPTWCPGLDILIVRELTGGIYFGQPRGVETLPSGERRGVNTLVYTESEIDRICRVAFDIAMKRGKRVCSVDKANVLECTELWREVAIKAVGDYPEIELSHMYVDNAAMQLVRAPKQFDVMVTTNMFGDILSDCAAMLTGSIGMLPSASLDEDGKGMYEPIHGSAPDIAGKGVANPLATILSVAMMLRYSLDAPEHAERIEKAVSAVLDSGLRTPDIFSEGAERVGTEQMGDAVVSAMRAL